MRYEVYRTNSNRSVVAIDKKYSKEEALRIANEHFKAKLDALQIETGRTLGDEELIFPKKSGDVWVVFRRGTNEM